MNCRYVHHWKWTLVEFPIRQPNGSDDGKAYRYWRAECIFCDLLSNRTASESPSGDSPFPTEKAGASLHSTSAPVPSRGA